ncbi:MAG TPA: tRNA pseudouridine(55) synthase TruB [Caldimonas sp.]|nr:tRNA pseudouridine(55) synthase TruB [Caldimonas sp.]HEX4235123.1 tRNA pseudouridine(55) synthase TruB [Caldimonas sp.]
MSATRAAARPRIVRRALHGVLLLDKDREVSSNAALQHAKRLYRAEKAGHTGTLDPLASGLLPLCFGAATKFAQASLDADKRYLATVRFGVTTTTGDLEGTVVRTVAGTDLDRAALDRACASFVGEILQLPPMHSALKHNGKPLYAYARAGIEVERSPRRVRIDTMRVVDGERDRWTIDVACSKGAYVRTLAEDLGAALGCGAHLEALRRTASGALDVREALSFADLEALAGEAARDACLLPPDVLVAASPAITLSADDAGRFLAGVRRRLDRDDAALVRVYGPEPGAFLGTGHVQGGELIASRLLSPAEVGVLVTRGRPTAARESLPA